MKKIRVLVTTSTFPRKKNDSTPRFILTLSKCVSATGDIECLVSAPHSPGSRLREEIEGIKVERYRYMVPYSLEKISGGGTILKIRSNKLLLLIVPSLLISQLLSTVSLVRKFKPDVILANWIVPQGLIAALLKLFYPRMKLIMVSHGGDAGFIQSHNLLSLICRYALKRADEVIAVSSFIRKIILNISRQTLNKLSVIPYGVDLEFFEPARNKGVNQNGTLRKGLLFIGRLEEKKGVQYLIESMPKVLEMYPDMTLRISGDGTLKRQLMNLAENLDIGNHVIFIGSVLHAQLIDVFSQAMIFIAPSINTKDDVEGLPNVILEAIAAKVPVITTDAGGITDIIEHNVTGVLVQQGRSDQLAKSVIELIRNHELRAALAENAYQKLLTNYTYSEMGKKYREVILKTLRGNDQRSKMHNKWHQTPSHILRKGCIEYVIRDWTPSPFIEFGAGTGDITKSFLQKGFFGICYDLGEENRNVLRRNLAQYQGKVEVIDDIESLKGRSFDYLFAFEVLEHIQNDDEVLSLWSPYLKARGKILISVPAHAKKYSKEDERVGHLRRYEKEGLYALLERAGYSNIHILNYGFPIGNMTRIVSKFLGGTDHSWDRLSSEERSIKSGIERLEIINRLSFFFNNVTLFPFILTQKIFFKKDWGEGYVAFAEKK